MLRQLYEKGRCVDWGFRGKNIKRRNMSLGGASLSPAKYLDG
jgi:hypothetical protein